MSEAKHTPGPWIPVFGTNNGWDVNGGKHRVCVEAWHGGIEHAQHLAQYRADAYLIAAAPDLLDALKSAIGLCDCSDYNGKALIPCTAANPCAGCYVTRKAEAAIAKAEGRE